MAHTSVPAHMDTLDSTVRTWFAGATRHPVRTGEVAGRGEPLIAASVRLAGLDFIVTSQVSPVRWQPNREESMLPICVVTRVSVWTQETFTTAIARLDILEVTVRSRWTNAPQTPAKMELHVLTS